MPPTAGHARPPAAERRRTARAPDRCVQCRALADCANGYLACSSNACVCKQKRSANILRNPGFDGNASMWTINGGSYDANTDADNCPASGSVNRSGLWAQHESVCPRQRGRRLSVRFPFHRQYEPMRLRLLFRFDLLDLCGRGNRHRPRHFQRELGIGISGPDVADWHQMYRCMARRQPAPDATISSTWPRPPAVFSTFDVAGRATVTSVMKP